MCRIIVECSTITGSTAYSASGILVKNANFPEEADRNRKRLPSGGRHQSGQSTVLLKNVVPVEGTASCVFVNPEKPDVPLNKNDAFQKVQKRRVQEKR